MKKYFFFAIAALGMLAGCQKQEINGGEIDDSSKVPVKFNVEAPSLVLTKGTGAIESWRSDLNLYILGYERGKGYILDDALIPNIVTAAPASNTEGQIEVKHPEKDGDKHNEPYFYGDGTKVYDFYGYYVDDAVPTNTTLTANAEKASINIAIDGTQDIMVAKAEPEWDILNSNDSRGQNLSINQVYSSYAARRDVHPTLRFDHKLTRFNFYVVAGSESGKKVLVQDIEINSHKEAELIIAPNPKIVPSDANTGTLKLSGIDTDGFKITVDRNDDSEAIIDNVDARIGKSIMAIAGETKHTITLTTVYDNTGKTGDEIIDQDIPPQVITLYASSIVSKDGKPVTKFEEGKQYDVILTVYGPEEIQITAVLNEWDEAGNTVLDPEKEWEVEPTEASATLVASTANSLTFDIVIPEGAASVKAELFAGATSVAVKDVAPSKATSKEVVFDGLTAGTEYSLVLSSKANKDAEYVEVEGAGLVNLVPAAVTITGAWYVHDIATYNQLPESYRAKYGSYNDYLAGHDNALPWLAVTVLPMDEVANIKVDNQVMDFTLDAGKTLITIAKEEITGFTGFEAGTTYTVTLTTTSGSASAEIVAPAKDFEVKKAYFVEESEASYNQLPESYRAKYGSYNDYLAGHDNALPWLAVEFTPGVPVTITVKNGATVKKFYQETTNLGLYTFCARELGLETLTPGDWTIIVNGIVKRVTVPAYSLNGSGQVGEGEDIE